MVGAAWWPRTASAPGGPPPRRHLCRRPSSPPTRRRAPGPARGHGLIPEAVLALARRPRHLEHADTGRGRHAADLRVRRSLLMTRPRSPTRVRGLRGGDHTSRSRRRSQREEFHRARGDPVAGRPSPPVAQAVPLDDLTAGGPTCAARAGAIRSTGSDVGRHEAARRPRGYEDAEAYARWAGKRLPRRRNGSSPRAGAGGKLYPGATSSSRRALGRQHLRGASR
jgi:hypothetical protein